MAVVLAQHNIPLAIMDHYYGSFGTSSQLLQSGSQQQEPKPHAS